MPPAWWLNSCCCKQEDYKTDVTDKHGGYLLEPPLEWHARADHFSQIDENYDDDNDDSSQHGLKDSTRARELHLRFWTAEITPCSPAQLASWVILPEKDENEHIEELPGAVIQNNELLSEEMMSSFYQDYNAQMTLHETYPRTSTRAGTTLVEPFPGATTFRARDSAQFILEETTSESSKAAMSQGKNSLTESSSLPPLQVRAEDLVSSASTSFLRSPPPSQQEPNIIEPSQSEDNAVDSFDQADVDCSVGDEGVTKQLVRISVNLLVAKRNKFIRVGDFATEVDENIWRLGRMQDERQFTRHQIEEVEHVNAIQKLLDGPFTRQQFSLFHDDELAEFELYTVYVKVAERRVPYIMIFEDLEQKKYFVTRLDRMRKATC